MAKLVIGTNKQTVVPAIVRDMSPAYYIEKSVDNNGNLINSSRFIDLSGLNGLSDNVLYEAYKGNTLLTSASFGSIRDISGYQSMMYCFNNCSNLITLDCSLVETISGQICMMYLCYGCGSLTQVDFSSLVSITGYGALTDSFQNCYSLTSVDFSSLTTVSSQNAFSFTFEGCSSLTSMTFPSLSVVTGEKCFWRCFRNCVSLTSVSFPALRSDSFGSETSQFDSMLYGCSNVAVHFPSNLQSVIGSWQSVTDGFGGTSTTVLFDLPATE